MEKSKGRKNDVSVPTLFCGTCMQIIEGQWTKPQITKFFSKRESKHIKVAQGTCCQTLANHISVFPVDVDKLPKYYADNVTAYFLCMASFIKICTCFDSLSIFVN